MDIALKKKNVYNPVEVMNMSKEVKTNAMRMLDKHHIRYDMIQYECDEFIDGLHTAEKTGAPVEQSFKTLVAQGKSKQYYVFVVPIAEEVQLKQAAKVAGEKSVELIPVKEITKITGYVRGGCSPLGMKKLFPTFIHNSAENFDKIYVSGGRIGTTICLDPKELAEVTRAQFADIIPHNKMPERLIYTRRSGIFIALHINNRSGGPVLILHLFFIISQIHIPERYCSHRNFLPEHPCRSPASLQPSAEHSSYPGM